MNEMLPRKTAFQLQPRNLRPNRRISNKVLFRFHSLQLPFYHFLWKIKALKCLATALQTGRNAGSGFENKSPRPHPLCRHNCRFKAHPAGASKTGVREGMTEPAGNDTLK